MLTGRARKGSFLYADVLKMTTARVRVSYLLGTRRFYPRTTAPYVRC